jgi:ubiquinone/menaquinone biosynthesis C-methylase UbiE
MTRDVRQWDRVSGTPSCLVERMPSQATYRQLIRTTLQLRPGDRVLDLGCGTGTYLPVLRDEVGPDGHVLGVDYSPKMIS